MIAPSDLRQYVIRPVLTALEAGGQNVEELLLGTAMQESGCGQYLVQRGGGPALGIWQMEPATHNDIWANYLRFRAPLAGTVAGFCFSGLPHSTQMVGNMYYACAMARVQYLRHPGELPKAGDIAGQAAYYKAVYNTAEGAADVADYITKAKTVLI